ncbi:MAG: DUF1847 domain-containing protein [Deltaproteobacteria bacterium]|nr:DUF1847 domain-containing protein [Deltaproteobacteria bacterium]MBT4639463.1 DUF1847 domain-containing protein [Deltaproteobacteria bacterium]MBT7155109.1 DUF1847 domain-containing protein [Deltaproteobacteria bacterium]
MDEDQLLCSYCAKMKCFKGDLSQSPSFCPSKLKPEVLEKAATALKETENQSMAQDVARTWKEYGKLTRVEETLQYAKLRGFQKLGLAFCVGLGQEAEMFTNILLNDGFDVRAVSCMCGALSSDDVDLPAEDKIFADYRQPMCNPIGQANLLDSEGCELNILLGLCVGDDTLFIKHSEAPVTVLAVKDRVLAHNPLGALYTSKNIYTRLNTRKPRKKEATP